MVTAESRLYTHHVVNQINCSVRIKGSCCLSSATSKGTVLFRIRNDRDELVPINLEVLVVLNLGASIFSVGALHEKGVSLDLLSVPPVLRHDNHAFPISTEVLRVYVLHIVPDTQEMQQNIFHTTVDADIWHRRMGHCHSRALKQLAEKPTTGVKFSHNVEAGEREVCAVSKSKKSAHPPFYRPRSNTRLELVHVDLWGKHPVVSYGDCQPIAMFADDMSRMRWVVLIRTKDEAADALKLVVQDVADAEGICVGNIRCNGGGQFKGRFQALAESLGIPIKTNAPYIPQGNSIAERGFGTIIGITRSLLLGAPHLPEKLWGEALTAAVYIRNRTLTDVLGGKAPLEVWESKSLGRMKHMHG